MAKIKVLVVDDAVVIRKILTDVLSADPDLEVVGTASNGKIALQKIAQLQPDVITLDIEMPELNGLETLPLIRKQYPRLPVIMFSTLTEKGASATLDALAGGASDYVTKPANVGSVTAARDAVRDDLIKKIKGLVQVAALPSLFKNKNAKDSNVTNKIISPASVAQTPSKIKVVAIGVSTGGPNALAATLPHLPANLDVPILIVQHMPPMFTRLLAERLTTQCKLPVVEASDGQEIKNGTIYIAPGDYHLEVVRSGTKIIAKLNQGPQENSCRPAVDVLFRSVARLYGEHTLAIVLTGMGQDGFIGCQHLKEVGATVIAQDKQSSVVWGMPGFVVEAGLADTVVPLDLIPQEITKKVLNGHASGNYTLSKSSQRPL